LEIPHPLVVRGWVAQYPSVVLGKCSNDHPLLTPPPPPTYVGGEEIGGGGVFILNI